jgi:hypothetical protein
MAKHYRVIYRDIKTQRFASRATWTRSRAHGGTRYKRTRISVSRKRPPKPATRPATRPTPQGERVPVAAGVAVQTATGQIPQEFLDYDMDDYFYEFDGDEDSEY